MRDVLAVVLAAIGWVYLLEALKREQRIAWVHYRTTARLWILNLLGAVLIGLAWLVFHGGSFLDFLCVIGSAFAIQQLVYDGIVHRRRSSGLR